MASPSRQSNWSTVTGLFLAVVALALIGWILSSIASLHERLTEISPKLATGALVGLLVILGIILLFGIRFLWIGTRRSRRDVSAKSSADPEKAAKQSLEAARQQLELVENEIARTALKEQLGNIESDLANERYTVVVFGTGSAGKTSIVNALLGNDAGRTSPIVGTTLEGEAHEYTVNGFEDGQLRLIDTPGLAEFGQAGMLREETARQLAGEADLLIFVVDQDLRDFELAPLQSLATLGKRVILAVNKSDLYPQDDLNNITKKLSERIGDVIDAKDVVVCAAAPEPVSVRDSATGATMAPETLDPDVTDLAIRIADVMKKNGRKLLANTILVRANRVARDARATIDAARREHAATIVSKFQWTTAGVLFVNPVPGLGALAAAAINFQMVTEISNVFGISVSAADAKKLASDLGQLMLKLGLVSVTTDLLGKALKASVVGYVAGGTIEAVAGAYLTRLSGQAFIEYFAEDQDWGEGGMQGAIERQFALQNKEAFLVEFIKDATKRIINSNKK